MNSKPKKTENMVSVWCAREDNACTSVHCTMYKSLAKEDSTVRCVATYTEEVSKGEPGRLVQREATYCSSALFSESLAMWSHTIPPAQQIIIDSLRSPTVQ